MRAAATADDEKDGNQSQRRNEAVVEAAAVIGGSRPHSHSPCHVVRYAPAARVGERPTRSGVLNCWRRPRASARGVPLPTTVQRPRRLADSAERRAITKASLEPMAAARCSERKSSWPRMRRAAPRHLHDQQLWRERTAREATRALGTRAEA